MKIRYHASGGDNRLILLESEPQVRSLLVQSQIQSLIHVPFPYLIHGITYFSWDNRFHYQGFLSRNGLFVGLRETPFSSFADNFYFCPTDLHGLSCLPHHHDNQSFSREYDLVKKVIDTWWSSRHAVHRSDAMKSLLDNPVKGVRLHPRYDPKERSRDFGLDHVGVDSSLLHGELINEEFNPEFFKLRSRS